MTENLGVYVNYAYELGDANDRDGEKDPQGNKDYENLTFGWSYTF